MSKAQRYKYMKKRISRGRSTTRNKIIEARWAERPYEHSI